MHQITTSSPGTLTAQYSGATPAACFYNPATRSVAASIASTAQATLKVTAGGQLLFGAVPLPCGGATATNTDTVVVTGTAGTAERLTIDQSEALFGPGVEVESTTPEIEVVANLGDASDRLVVIGTSGDDKLSAGVNGVAIDADNDVDVTFAPSPPPATVELVGGGGKNTLTARGGSGTAAVFTGSVVLRAGDLGDILTGSNLNDLLVGGAGNDDVNGYGGDDTIDGGAGDDKLNGADGNDDTLGGLGADSISSGSGDDTIRAADGIADPVLNGGAGIDTAYYDLSDPVPSAVENKILDSGPPPPPPGPDTTPPETTITSGPASPTSQTTATFALVSSEAGSTFACALDLGPFLPCASPVTYSGLALGSHQLRVRATDAAGNVDPTPAAYSWTIEVAPPPPPPPPPGQGTCVYSATLKSVNGHDPGRRNGDARGRRQRDPLRRRRLRRRDDREHRRDHGHRRRRARSSAWSSTSRRARSPRARPRRRWARTRRSSWRSTSETQPTSSRSAALAAPTLLSAGIKGVSFTADADLDITFSQVPGSVELAGGAGNDTLSAGGGYGTGQLYPGRVTLRGDAGDDALSGSGLDDLLVGGTGADTLQGGSGNDELLGEAGNDTLQGQDGNDRLVGGPGADSLSGGNGDDTLDAADGEADSLIHGQIGVDTAYYDLGLDPAPVSTENAVPGPPPPTGLLR